MTKGRSRMIKGALVFFTAGAALGAVFALLGPVAVIRVLGLVAFACAAAGCALHLVVLHRTDQRAYRIFLGRLSGTPAKPRVGVLHSAVLSPRPAARG